MDAKLGYMQYPYAKRKMGRSDECAKREIFVNDGEQVITAAIYTDLEADGISFYAVGMVMMDVVKYDLNIDNEELF